MATRPEDLNHREANLTWKARTDGTLTSVEISDGDEVFGAGTARRAKGDRRNEHLGLALATARAHEAAAKCFYEAAEELGWQPPPKVAVEAPPEQQRPVLFSEADIAKLRALLKTPITDRLNAAWQNR